MAKARAALPDDLQHLLDLLKRGKPFALQEWIKAGKRLHVPEIDDYRAQVLRVAVETGFHSIVEELLRAGGWNRSELVDALDAALCNRRSDLVDLLLTYGASLEQLDFQTVCGTIDLTLMERYLRAGGDPCCNNGFAHALSTIKARPLLRFYRQFRTEFPALDDQAALALAQAVDEGKVRWICLLVWAGADPFRPVPWNLEGGFPVSPEDSTSAAIRALWQDKPEVLKALKLNPTPGQARELLGHVGYRVNLDLVRSLLKAIPRSEINETDRCSSSVLENLVRRGADTNFWTRTVDQDREANSIKAMELLLDHGARWNPAPEQLRYARRGLLEHDGRYIVQVLRLLLYTPGAADLEAFKELCRSQTLGGKVAAADPPLARDLAQLRKKGRAPTDACAAASKETPVGVHRVAEPAEAMAKQIAYPVGSAQC